MMSNKGSKLIPEAAMRKMPRPSRVMGLINYDSNTKSPRCPHNDEDQMTQASEETVFLKIATKLRGVLPLTFSEATT
ncbi:hypothetical protein DUI87_18414 [Hirundo rustica rustica]|uniref:Uncharacterized protein n=1 Tax=Hirundo rustica rustica TaxID=333673 RepID=A0A3M0K1U3_HIRRU|nr:hypothetical protein DUI87_18414 [Hirundo rustica rustica]